MKSLEERLSVLENYAKTYSMQENCNNNEYMRGIANGFIIADAIMKGQNPEYAKTKDITNVAISFTEGLRKLLNCNANENESNTPDFILAEFLKSCLDIFNSSVIQRDKWYDFKPDIDKLNERKESE